ncbi:MAG: cobalamin biosynthesis protein [Chloroflexi bacterium]|nr:cobalamin biosynthesis protein [Chloroflexota bacterium]
MEILLILVLAVALDLTIGEPPRAIHPVVWMGKVVSFLVRGGNGQAHLPQFFLGMGIVLVTVGLFTIPVFLILFHLKRNRTPPAPGILCSATGEKRRVLMRVGRWVPSPVLWECIWKK